MTNNSSKNVNKLRTFKKIWKKFERQKFETWKSLIEINLKIMKTNIIYASCSRKCDQDMKFTQPKLKKTTIGSNSENNPKFRQVRKLCNFQEILK